MECGADADSSTAALPARGGEGRLPEKIRKQRAFYAQFAPKRFQSLLKIVDGLPKDAMILDFGCGSGRNTYALLDLGYENVYGFDIKDYVQLRSPADRSRFRTRLQPDGRLPYDDATFDLVISDQVFEHVLDQVSVFRELHRITKPGGRHFHIIPSPYRLVEPHVRVLFGGMIVRPAWYRLWARLGFRQADSHDVTAKEAAERAIVYYHSSVKYVSSAAYKVIWRRTGFDYRFVDQEYFDTHWRAALRAVGKLNRIVPIFGWLHRVFRVRHVLLTRQA
ncbi:MAG TPA: class I SAM-dependent methyltransferase [Woeseiaceae bacterium]|nr:class I SAM-dependent methyltransferase [Woeseiaceae bacterium]